ncbi:hypothetical protein SAY87_002015 [Trapa incisa]|uniref:Uncharacterized protein n=1 Tax=Trapa incisa TaxID=236973 RepID=A0AAN7JU92_9MYRT|nr:hypothetical protein SAY87_002015 [Trapa incisa]
MNISCGEKHSGNRSQSPIKSKKQRRKRRGGGGGGDDGASATREEDTGKGVGLFGSLERRCDAYEPAFWRLSWNLFISKLANDILAGLEVSPEVDRREAIGHFPCD